MKNDYAIREIRRLKSLPETATDRGLRAKLIDWHSARSKTVRRAMKTITADFVVMQ